MLKRLSLIITSFYFSLVFLSDKVSAQTLSPTRSIKIGPCGTDDTHFERLCSSSTASHADNILRNIVISAITFAALLALIFLIWGGFKWITSGGDKAKVEAARNTIIAAIVGLILALLSYVILSTVLRIFGVDLLQLTLPTLQ
ncbi:MAG: hypothetical protein KBC15_03610 [Candidatus Levybacteria bacterium]|nr:hypothetical protein [Candidatus Levybacteria bacterium]